MMRALAEGRVRWCFWPPGSEPKRDGQGLWLGERESTDDEYEFTSDDGSDSQKEAAAPTKGEDSAGDSDDDESDGESEAVKLNNASFFAALSLEDAE